MNVNALTTATKGSDLIGPRPGSVLGRILGFIDRTVPIWGLMPLLAFLILVNSFPFVFNIWIGFTNFNLMYEDFAFVGLRNFGYVLTDRGFWSAFQVGVIFTVATLTIKLVIGTGGALLLNQPVRFSMVYRILIMVPWAFPFIVKALVWRWILTDYTGILNRMLYDLGLIDKPINWLVDLQYALPSVVLINVWSGYPIYVVTLLAGLQAIPREYYEVAKIEGASFFQTLRLVTLPCLRGVIAVLLILATTVGFNAFDVIFLITEGGPMDLTTNVPIYVYRLGFEMYQIGQAASATILMFLLIALVAYIYIRTIFGRREQYE